MPFNANISPSNKSKFSDGDVVIYECKEGWAMLGQASKVCQSGSWFGAMPVCSKFQFDSIITFLHNLHMSLVASSNLPGI